MIALVSSRTRWLISALQYGHQPQPRPDIGVGTLGTVAFVKNLADKEYFTHGVDLGDFTGFTWGRPRTFGLRIKRTF